MKSLLIFFILIISCGYPDIDSVPNFEDLIITEEESIDLCNLMNIDKNDIDNCVKNINK